MSWPPAADRPHPCRVLYTPQKEETPEERERRIEKQERRKEIARERRRHKVEMAKNGLGEWPT